MHGLLYTEYRPGGLIFRSPPFDLSENGGKGTPQRGVNPDPQLMTSLTPLLGLGNAHAPIPFSTASPDGLPCGGEADSADILRH